MRKIFAFITAALIVLTLCACDIPTPFIDIGEYKTKKPSDTTSSVPENKDKPEEPVKPKPEEFGVKIETKDISITSQDGRRKIELLYDLITLPDSYQSINTAANSNFEKFKKTCGIAKDHLNKSNGYHNIYKAEITNTSNNILSVKYETDWYMGGIRNKDYYGLNFNIESGKLLNLKDMTDKPDELLKAVKSKIKSYISSSGYTTYEDWEFYLDNTKLEDFLFFAESNKITVCIPSYSLAHADAGAMNIKTDIALDNNGKVVL